jgi:hypothetical protein
MPDWVSHLLLGYFVATLLGIKNKKPVYIGVLLPDAFKIFIPLMTLLEINNTILMNFFAPYHTVVGVFLSGIIVASFFENLKTAYMGVILGAFTHLVADSFLYPWGTNIWFLWPLWQGDPGTGILWSDSFTPLFITSLLSIFAFTYRKVVESKL